METNPRGPLRKLGVVTQLAIAACIVVVLLIAWASRTLLPPAPEPAKMPPVKAAPAALTPTQPQALTRTELLAEANAIAAAYAAGAQRDLKGKDPLIGQPFAIRVPFGCAGPAGASSGLQAYYELDPEARTLRVVARPVDWTATLAPRGDVASKAEIVEGFWLSRPWSYSESCPPSRDAPVLAAASSPSAETLGLAAFHTSDDSRVSRRIGRPYEFVKKLGDDDALPLGEAYRLVLEGVIKGLPNGRAARCWSESADHRPVCLYAVEFSRIALERQDGELLTEWRLD